MTRRLQDFNFALHGEQTSLTELRKFEDKIGGCIDDNCVEFLLEINGGVPSPELTINGSDLKILNFPGLTKTYGGLQRAHDACSERLSLKAKRNLNLLPFACDSSIGRLVISVGRKHSEVHHIPDYDYLLQDDSEMDIIKVADSFVQFMCLLSQL